MTGTDDVKIIEGVIQSYLDGLYESDAGKIASVTSQRRSVVGRISRRRNPPLTRMADYAFANPPYDWAVVKRRD